MSVAAHIPLGTRVVVRHRLPPGYSHPMTDVIGVLQSHEPITVRTADQRTVQISDDQVIAIKPLGVRPVRTGEIRELELAAALAWPGVESAWISGWLVRFGYGNSPRTDSAAPLGMPGELAAFDVVAPELRSWYGERGRPLRLALPDRLSPKTLIPSTDDAAGTFFAADLENLALPDSSIGAQVSSPRVAQMTAEPDAQWLTLYPNHTGHHIEVLRAVRGGEVAFARIANPGERPLAIVRAAVTRAPGGRIWVGLSCAAVAPEHRRRGVGALLCAEMAVWGKAHGATHIYAQVDAGDNAAATLCRSLGLIEHHRYRYVAV